MGASYYYYGCFDPPSLGVAAQDGGALSNYPLPTPMVYHIDRLARPDISPKPGTPECIRREDEIHGFVARFPTTVRFLSPRCGGKTARHRREIPERTTPANLRRVPYSEWLFKSALYFGGMFNFGVCVCVGGQTERGRMGHYRIRFFFLRAQRIR